MQSDKFKLTPYQTFYIVFLNLPDKKYKPLRKIGEYLPKLKAYFKKVSLKQIYRKFDSVGFNYSFVSEFGPANFTLVYIQLKNNFLYTSRQSILKNGLFEIHSKNDLDLQIHLPLKYFRSSIKEALLEASLIEQSLNGERSKPDIKTSSAEIPGQTFLFQSAE